MVPEIWNMTNKTCFILDHLFPLYPPNNPENQNFGKMKTAPGDIIILHMCTIWFLSYGAQQTEYFVILAHFLPINPTNNQKDQNFEKMKYTPGDITILHLCNTNDDHTMYGS